MIIRTLFVSVAALLLATTAQAQASGQQSLASTLQVYVFPGAGQAAEQQSKDEAECYQWAVNSSGSDPFEVQNQQADRQLPASRLCPAGESGLPAASGTSPVRRFETRYQ